MKRFQVKNKLGAYGEGMKKKSITKEWTSLVISVMGQLASGLGSPPCNSEEKKMDIPAKDP